MAALAVAAGLALAGCEVSGSIDLGQESLAFDLTFIEDNPTATDVRDSCPVPGNWFTTAVQDTLPDGRTRCRVAGTSLRSSSASTDDGLANQVASWSSDHVFFSLPAFDAGDVRSLDRVDLRITAPGPIVAVAPGSVPFGNTVHVTDARRLGEGGVTLVASLRPGLSVQGWSLLGGTLAGLGGGGAAAWWWRRRRTATTTEDGGEP